MRKFILTRIDWIGSGGSVVTEGETYEECREQVISWAMKEGVARNQNSWYKPRKTAHVKNIIRERTIFVITIDIPDSIFEKYGEYTIPKIMDEYHNYIDPRWEKPIPSDLVEIFENNTIQHNHIEFFNL